MATINKHVDMEGKTTYRVRVRMKGHPMQTATFKRLTDAKKWGGATEEAIREGRYFNKVEAKKRTLNELIDRYVERVLPEKKESTKRTQKNQLDWWRDQLGVKTLSAVDASAIADCRDELIANGRTPSTANRYMAVLSHCLAYAKSDLQWIEQNPCLDVRKGKESRGVVRFLSSDERTRLLTACKESSNKLLYPAVLLALSTGMRRSEQMTLTWKQIDLASGRITLTDTKNGETRVTVATGPALTELKALAKVRKINCDLVFPGQRNTPIILSKPWYAALNAAEIEDFRWHDLRHSFASELAMNGATLAEIAECMGHKTLSMVKRYAHLTEGHISSVIERMTTRVFGGDV